VANEVGTNVKAGYIKEVTWGTTPAATALQLFRFTGITPKATISSTQSEELTTAREIQDFVQTDTEGGFNFNFDKSYGNLDDILESLQGGAWTANILKTGNTRKPLSLEAQFTGITQFCAWKGAICNEFNFSIQKGQIIKGSAGFMSKFPVWGVTSIGNANTAAPTNAIMEPIASVQLMQEGGAGSILGPTEFSCSIKNTLIPFPYLGSADLLDLQMGQLEAKGTFSAYFADRTYVDKFMAWTDTSLQVRTGGVSTKRYDYLWNKIKLGNVDIQNIAVNKAVIAKVEWMAKVDATETTLKITRNP
jgi:hypothetical protein